MDVANGSLKYITHMGRLPAKRYWENGGRERGRRRRRRKKDEDRKFYWL